MTSTGLHDERATSNSFHEIAIKDSNLKGLSQNKIKTTKYTYLTFLPLFLFYQFSQFANIFFLINSIFQVVPAISPLINYTYTITFIIMLFISMLRELFEEYIRSSHDSKINNQVSHIFISNELKETTWESINRGDIIKVFENEFIPADILVINSSLSKGECYVQTSSLDGEKALKIKYTIPSFVGLFETNSNLDGIKGNISIKKTDSDLHHIEGKVRINDSHEYVTFSLQNAILRGSKLSNTEWILGIPFYTGMETKIIQNQKKPIQKASFMNSFLNYLLIFKLLIYIIISIILAALQYMYLKNAVYGDQVFYSYLNISKSKLSFAFYFRTFIAYFVLLSVLIPISLLAATEIVKFVQCIFISNDMLLYSEGKAQCNVSTLNEELGNIKYIFSDKTGTLTKNIMTLRLMSIGSMKYEVNEFYNKVKNIFKGNAIKMESKVQIENDNIREIKKGNKEVINKKNVPLNFNNSKIQNENLSNQLVNKSLNDNDNQIESMENIDNLQSFIYCIMLCNDIIPIKGKNQEINYSGVSPDEIALLDGIKPAEIVIKEKTQETVTLKIFDKEVHFKILNKIDFTSDRKCATIIVRDNNNRCHLFIKGSDDAIIKRQNKSLINQKYEKICDNVKKFSEEGLRILCMGTREISEKEYNDFSLELKKISELGSDNKDALLNQLYEKIETGINLIGASGIEDELQDLAPLVVNDLINSGIYVWMLTGDKKETAHNIALKINLVKENSKVFFIEEKENPNEDIKTQLSAISKYFANNKISELDPHNKTASKSLDTENSFFEINSHSSSISKKRLCSLLIEGSCLSKILLNPEISKDFINLSNECESLIIYRATPKEKGNIVNYVKSLNVGRTLAIGDGQNDVNMIMQANVGIGIRGLEGLQAANNADFSIGEFKGLWRLLFVHGRSNCSRLAFFTAYFYFKSAALALQQFLFAFYSGYSGQTVFDETGFSMYNAIFTTFPVIFYAIFDKDINWDKNKNMASILNKLYFDTEKFSFKLYIKWFIYGICSSVAIYYISLFSVSTATINPAGKNMGLWFSSAISVTSVVVLDYALLVLNTTSWDIVIVLSYTIIGICLYIPIWVFLYKTKYFSDLFLLYTREGSFWYIILCCVGCCLIAYYIVESIIYHINPSLTSQVFQKINETVTPNEQLTLKIAPENSLDKTSSLF